ncbi:MAG TPA: M20/M25/M40 family metallo-hydrolase, partial [Vicinamibacteria bacterium]|nr:M20/M25/M40 family metallo-hydrolase [Vicinamibacteria bacterium]
MSTARDDLAGFEAARDALVQDLADLVRRESPSDEAGRVSDLAAWVRDRLRSRGAEAEVVPCPPRGDALRASVGGGGGALLLGHVDTVWPVGSWGPDPFAIEGDLARGPGVFDMKAGIAVAMAVLPALAREGVAASLLLVPDEEVGTEASRALLLDTARAHEKVLVLEPSLDGAA